MNKKVLFTVIFAGAIAFQLGSGAGSASAVPETPEKWEKCAGVSKAGKNDCGSIDKSHDCGGLAKKDNDPNEWVFVPEGTCEKLGGKVVEVVPAKAKE
ncbi:MAG: DUF2282 domain-containing protein [Deltaproteobacteria bacterium]|nr:DUF2282 domain-containing protein [Deltaproteobacteria bacterium]